MKDIDKEYDLTLLKCNLQWLINKQKNDSEKDYMEEIIFAKLKLEDASGHKVKINFKR